MWPTRDEVTTKLVRNIAGCESLSELSESYFLKHLIIALREGIWSFIEIAETVYSGQTVKRASGPELDNLGYDFGVTRTEATKAVHSITIKKSAPVTNETIIPDNFLLTTTSVSGISPVKFVVQPEQKKSLLPGETETTVFVECVEFGEIGNVDDGAINLVAQAGFDSVSDSKIYTKAVEAESDDSYRERILIRKRTPARAGVITDYERWAREIAGVSKAKAFRTPRGPGTVDIVIWGADGGLPDIGLIKKVQAYIDGVTPADIADGGVIVYAPEEIYVEVIIGNAVVNDEDYKALEAALREYFGSEKASSAITFVDLVVTINKALDNFKLIWPDSDIELSGRQAARLGKLEVRTEFE